MGQNIKSRVVVGCAGAWHLPVFLLLFMVELFLLSQIPPLAGTGLWMSRHVK